MPRASGKPDDASRRWTSVDNDTGPNPPSAYGGGYHCRHRWVAIDRSEWRNYPRWQDRPYPDEQG
jgi:hypothetical protein